MPKARNETSRDGPEFTQLTIQPKGRPEPCEDYEDIDNDDDDYEDDDNEDVDDDGGREVGGGSVKVVSSRPQLPSHPLTLIKIIIIIWISSFAIEKHIVKQEQL